MRTSRLLTVLLFLAVGASASLPPALGGSEAESATKKVKLPRKPGCTPKWSKRSQRSRNVDRDRLPNIVDPDIDGDRKKNGSDRNIDGDRRRNQADRDIDADGIPNRFDRDIDSDRRPNTKDADMDADRIKNRLDRDMDGDLLPNKSDDDIDGDCLRNAVDPDMDGDGIPNFADLDAYSAGSSAAVAGPEAVRARVPPGFFGIVSEQAIATRGVERQRFLNQVDGTGARVIRQTFDWAELEKFSPGAYDWRYYDEWMRQVTARGYTVLAVLFNPPSFRSSRPGDPERGIHPPASNAEFAEFAAQVVRRYGPGGAFWARNPNLRAHPIVSWQVWNEPNIRYYWPDGADPAAYVSMLRTVGSAIKSVDPRAEIIAAGLPESPGEGHMGLTEFVTGMYDAGAKGAFDALAVHPYAGSAEGSFELLDMVRRIMDARGDGSSGLRVTEIGWADKGPPSPFTVGEAGQAEMIRRVFATFVAQKDWLRLRGIVYWNLKDEPPYRDRPDFWGLHTGLYTIDERPKPALGAYVSTVRTLTSD